MPYDVLSIAHINKLLKFNLYAPSSFEYMYT